jgi:hypothetical protein
MGISRLPAKILGFEMLLGNGWARRKKENIIKMDEVDVKK